MKIFYPGVFEVAEVAEVNNLETQNDENFLMKTYEN